jgi:hypothetical protein
MIEQLDRWTKYALRVQCQRCGEPIFEDETDAREAVEAAWINFDLGDDPATSDVRAALMDACDGLCGYCRTR